MCSKLFDLLQLIVKIREKKTPTTSKIRFRFFSLVFSFSHFHTSYCVQIEMQSHVLE